MKLKFIALILISLYTETSYAQCFAPINLFSSNVNYYNAEVNWTPTSTVSYFRIRYKQPTATSWFYINNIDSSLTSKLITNLTPLNEYIWQIKSYCDTTNTSSSNWSVTDTFTTNTLNCPNTNFLFTTNINYNDAVANWDTVSFANRYKVRYRVLGTGNWLNLGDTYHPTNYRTIPLLQQNTLYEWQIQTHHDSTTLLASLWSPSDTFLTPPFVPSMFNPIVINSLSTLECGAQAEFYLKITQLANEPDVGTGAITSDGGFFNISSINSGDSVGHASMTTASQTINTTLKAGIILGSNYAIINSYDSIGNLMGFFTIENQNNGVKVEILGSPNDGNNYTSGYTSEIYFTNLFVNPPNSGPLHFFTDINSELNDQIYSSDTVQIWCNTTTIKETYINKKLMKVIDLLGRRNKQANQPLFYIYDDGVVEKRIFFK